MGALPIITSVLCVGCRRKGGARSTHEPDCKYMHIIPI